MLQKCFNENISMDKDQQDQLAYVNKGLLAASTSNTHLKAGIPYSTPLISGSGHKDSLSRLGNAM